MNEDKFSSSKTQAQQDRPIPVHVGIDGCEGGDLEGAGIVLSLNYHEVTKDPRVFKQAKALVERGYRVVVMCRWLEGYPKAETVAGIEIVRFDCFAHHGASDLDLNLFAFLDGSRPLVEERYTPYVEEVRKLQALSYAREWAEARVASTQSVFDSIHSDAAEGGPEAGGMSDLLRSEESLAKAAAVLSARINELRVRYKTLNEKIKAGKASEAELHRLRKKRDAARTRVSEWVETREMLKRQRVELKAILDRIEAEDPELHVGLTQRARDCQSAEYRRRSARDARSWLVTDLKVQALVVKEKFRELYQAQSITFAVNLMRETIPCTPAIIHAHDFYTLPAAICLAQKAGARVLYDAHEYEPGRATKMPPEGHALVDAMELDCLRHVDRMTTVSPSIAALYRDRFPGGEPELVLNAPEFDLAAFNAANPPRPRGWQKLLASPARPGKLRALAGLDASVPLIVFTGGTQRENRGMDKLCQALRELPGYHFVALGPRLLSDDAWLIQHAEQAGVRGRVHLLQSVPPNQIVETISDADLAICPIQDAGISYRLALPNKLFEAAFARLPVLVSDLPEMRRFVEELGIGKAMDQTDPRCIASAIREVMAKRDHYVLSREKAEYMISTYSWQAQKVRLAKIVLAMAPHALGGHLIDPQR